MIFFQENFQDRMNKITIRKMYYFPWQVDRVLILLLFSGNVEKAFFLKLRATYIGMICRTFKIKYKCYLDILCVYLPVYFYFFTTHSKNLSRELVSGKLLLHEKLFP